MTLVTTPVACRCTRCCKEGTTETFRPHSRKIGTSIITDWYCPECSELVDRLYPPACMRRRRPRR